MLETIVRAELNRDTSASPDRAWLLLGGSVAWSLRPGRFAFDVAASAGSGRLLFVMCAGQEAAACEVWRAVEEQPNRVIRWQCLSTAPGRSQVVTLALRPAESGATAGVSVTESVRRGQAGGTRRRWDQDLRLWLDAVHAVLEGQAPWPSTGIPAGIARGCADFPAMWSPERISASVLIAAAPEVVWEEIYAPETNVRDDPAIMYAGHVPGTPGREAGEMQYFIRQQPDGRLTGDVIVVQDVADRRRALVRQITFPYSQIDHLVTPEGNGTRLELTYIVPIAVLADQRMVASNMHAVANKYKEQIEKPIG
jgi:hypothetical protein